MANIIYGISGQGFGHAARSHEVLVHLKQKGHKIMILTYNQAADLLSRDFKVVKIPGLGLNYQNNRVIYWRTVYDNASTLMRESKNWPKLMKKIERFKPDLVITDYEPVSTAIAHLRKLPLISLNNQHQLTNTKLTVPRQFRRDFLIDKLITRSMVWKADYYLVTTFFKTPIIKPNTFLFPPIIRRRVAALKPSVKDFVLVYQNSDFDYILDELKKLAPEKFYVYSGRPGTKRDGNLTLKNYHSRDWYSDLKNCKAIIGTAGLSLISEALWLDKPYFAIPVAQQVEQTINALQIKKLGYGNYADTFTAKDGRAFLKRLTTYRQNLKKQPKAGMKSLFTKLDGIIKELV